VGDPATSHDVHPGFTRAWVMGFMVLACLAVMAGGARAAEPAAKNSLYDVALPVENQSAAARHDGFRQGVELLIKRLTGRPQPEGSEVLKAAGASAGDMVARYFYSESGEGRLSGKRTVLHMRFKKTAIRRFLRQRGLPFWGEGRPPVLLWMVQEEEGRRHFVGDRQPTLLASRLEQAATDWGLDVTWPLFDFQDQEAVHVSDIWGLFVDPVRQASARYGHDEVLVLRVRQTDAGLWDGHARFVFRGKVLNWSLSHVAFGALTQQLMQKVAGTMASYYAVDPTKGESYGSVRLRIDGVRSAASYAAALRLVEKVTAVRKIDAFEVQGGTLLIKLSLEGTLSQLDAAMVLSPHVLRVASPAGQEGAAEKAEKAEKAESVKGAEGAEAGAEKVTLLHYRWRP